MSDAAVMDFKTRANYESDFLEEDYRWIIGRLMDADLQQICSVNLTKPAFNISVVKVVVPGLECNTSPANRILKKRGMDVLRQREPAE